MTGANYIAITSTEAEAIARTRTSFLSSVFKELSGSRRSESIRCCRSGQVSGALDAEQIPSGAPPRRLLRWTSSRSEEHTSELQSLMRISYAVFCLKKKNKTQYK